jgi:hypothetical protein
MESVRLRDVSSFLSASTISLLPTARFSEIDSLIPIRSPANRSARAVARFWEAHAPSRAGDRVLAIANFLDFAALESGGNAFRRGRQNVHPKGRVRSPEFACDVVEVVFSFALSLGDVTRF